MKAQAKSKKKVWIDAGLIGATDLPKELIDSSKGMRKVPKSPEVARKDDKG